MKTVPFKRAVAILAFCLIPSLNANAAKCCEKVIFEIGASGNSATGRKLSKILATYTIDPLGSPPDTTGHLTYPTDVGNL